MSNRSRELLMVMVVCVALVAAGCAKPPEQAIQAAQAALASAEGAAAPTYAAEAWAKAQGSLSAAMAEIDAQKAKFALTRSYKNAEQLLATASADAAAAQEAAIAGKQQALADSQAALQAVMDGLGKADELLAALAKCPRRPKGFAQDLELMKGSVEGLRPQVPGIESAIASEDYLQAKSLGESLRAEVERVVGDLESAKTKLGC
jgi:exonuclease VII large subunit